MLFLAFATLEPCIISNVLILFFSPTYNSLLTTLNLALQNSGVDLSQASISVQINLGKRAIKRCNDPGPNPTSKVLAI
jgi:hypothetical protein